MISNKNKLKHVTLHRRKSNTIMTLKTRDIMGPRKHAKDPVVTLEDDTSVGGSENAKIIKNWYKFGKDLSQRRFCQTL